MVFMQIDIGKAQKFALTTIYKGIASQSARKKIPRYRQILRQKRNSRKRPILTIIQAIKKKTVLYLIWYQRFFQIYLSWMRLSKLVLRR